MLPRRGAGRFSIQGRWAAFGAARHVGQVGDSSSASSQFNGSTGLHWRCRLTPEIQAASDDNSSGLPSAQCCERAGVFRDSPAGAAAGRRRATETPSAAALGHDSTERRRGGIPNTLTSSGSGLKQSAFASAFSRSRLCGGGSLFFPRTSLHDLCDESPGAGRGPARPRAKTRRLSRG